MDRMWQLILAMPRGFVPKSTCIAKRAIRTRRFPIPRQRSSKPAAANRHKTAFLDATLPLGGSDALAAGEGAAQKNLALGSKGVLPPRAYGSTLPEGGCLHKACLPSAIFNIENRKIES